MRNMSFFMTTQQIIDETKTVTRRFGWWGLLIGDKIQACEKCQGLGIGEKVNRLKVIETVSTRGEPLNAITKAECVLEGFPDMEPAEFVAMMVKHYGCNPDRIINRIEFKYITKEHAERI